jgi:hypothetical protein
MKFEGTILHFKHRAGNTIVSYEAEHSCRVQNTRQHFLNRTWNAVVKSHFL